MSEVEDLQAAVAAVDPAEHINAEEMKGRFEQWASKDCDIDPSSDYSIRLYVALSQKAGPKGRVTLKKMQTWEKRSGSKGPSQRPSGWYQQPT